MVIQLIVVDCMSLVLGYELVRGASLAYFDDYIDNLFSL